MNRRLTALVAAGLVGLSGCNGDDDDTPSGSSGPSRSTDSGSQAADYKRAEASMKRNDYDNAIPLMEAVGDFRDARARVAQFRTQAARETLAEARTKIKSSPRAAVSLAATSLRYESTSQAEAFLDQADAALQRFKKRGQDDD